MSDLVSITTPLARHPLACRFSTSDVPTFWQVFIQREYVPLDDLPKVSLVIDCGANVGYSSAYFLSRFPDAEVIAVEPDADNFEVLRRNLAPYGGRAHPMHAGVWSHECRLKMAEGTYRDGREWSRQVRECGPDESSDLEGIDLDTLLKRSGLPRISILKMDIEGAEGVVFSANYERWIRQVDNIAIELHDDSAFGRCTPVFFNAISGDDFAISGSGELTICTRRLPRPFSKDALKKDLDEGVMRAGAPDHSSSPADEPPFDAQLAAEFPTTHAYRAGGPALPMVSCLCPTYNRAPGSLRLVEEAVESFLRQDYPNKELVVLNDTPGQVLRCDHPRVRIVNTPFRCNSLGEKRNLMAALATGELICVWDDDDISLPWRLSTSIRMLGDSEYYNPASYWFLDGDGLHHDHAAGVGYFTSIYRKSAYQELGGTPNISLGEDFAMDQKLRARRAADAPPLPLEQWYYLYRWGPSPCHLSSVPGDAYYAELGKLPIAEGEFRLRPHWEQDYAALTRGYLSGLRALR